MLRGGRWLGVIAAAALLVTSATAQAQVKQAEIVKAITEAFEAWEKIDCTDLKFEIQPTLTALPQPVEKDGGILVAFFGYKDTWTSGNLAYFSTSTIELIKDANLKSSVMAMNATTNYGWSLGKLKNKIDIKTAVMHIIPNLIGFYVGSQPKSQSLEDFIKYDYVEHALLPQHEAAARFTYFKNTGGACTQTPEPVVCGEPQPAPDGGIKLDGGAASDGPPAPPIQNCIFHSSPNDKPKGKAYSWTSQPIKVWIYVAADGNLPGGTAPPTGDGGPPKGDGSTPTGDGSTPTGDGSTPTGDGAVGKPCATNAECPVGQFCAADGKCTLPGSADDGCCSVAATAEENVTATSLFLLGIALILLRRRRK